MNDPIQKFENKALQSDKPLNSMKTLTLGVYVLQGLSIFLGLRRSLG